MPGEWSYAGASVMGSSHSVTGTACQDACAWKRLELDGQEILILCVADGAGSARLSQEGSVTACSFMLERVESWIVSARIKNLERDHFAQWIMELREMLTMRAQQAGESLRQYASTLLVCVLSPEACAFLQLGDGAIVVSDQDERDDFAWIFWPDQGEYANVTTFVTSDDALEKLQFSMIEQPFEEVAVFTDGLQRLALKIAEKSVHAPFFRMVFAPLRRDPPGESEGANSALTRFLQSKDVCSRTDDDKTLVLATRKRSVA